MGNIKIHPPVKFFCAVTFIANAPVDLAESQLLQLIGEIDGYSHTYNFDPFTGYYQAEMGSSLQKKIISFRELKPVELLADIKIATNLVEDQYRSDRKRQINLDPGYITAAKIVLATTKDFDHRLYLGRGIFGDIHLRYRNGHFQFQEWTYPDYRQPELVMFFEKLRSDYLSQLQHWKDA